MPELSFFIIALLFSVGLLAGAVDAVAGGGGLISIPALMLVPGFSPAMALGTNKFQSSFGTASATYNYYKNGLFSFRSLLKGIVSGILGAFLGAVVTHRLDSSILTKVIPFLLVFVLVYSLFSPKLSDKDEPPKISDWIFYPVAGFVLGFYDGFFGPGTGAFWVIGINFFLGLNLKKATACTKLLNLNSNLVALVYFLSVGQVSFQVGLTMAAGQMVGGKIGSQLVVSKGARFIKPFFICVTAATILALLFHHKKV